MPLGWMSVTRHHHEKWQFLDERPDPALEPPTGAAPLVEALNHTFVSGDLNQSLDSNILRGHLISESTAEDPDAAK